MQPASDGGGPSRRSSQLRRYGPLAVIVVLLIVVAAVVVAGGGDDEVGDTAGAANEIDWVSVEGTEPGAPAPTGDMPVTYDEADEDGTVDDHEWPETCDTERGTLAIPSVYALPCVPAFEGDNGGAAGPRGTPQTMKVG